MLGKRLPRHKAKLYLSSMLNNFCPQALPVKLVALIAL
jgi:hypothetical protein